MGIGETCDGKAREPPEHNVIWLVVYMASLGELSEGGLQIPAEMYKLSLGIM